MLPSPVRAGLAILTAMDLTSRVLVVLGLAAGAVIGVMAVVASMTVVGVDAHGGISQLLTTMGGVAGAVIGVHANLASGRLLAAERAGDFA
jgi:Fe2+ transport system protein FeoA